MTLAELQVAFEDDTHPRHEEARRRSAEMTNNLRPALEKISSSVASQIDYGKFVEQARAASQAHVDEIMEQARKAGAIASEMNIDSLAPNTLPSHPIVPPSPLHDTEWMEESMQAIGERQRRQDATAEASLEAMQAVAAQMQQLNEKMTDVENRLEDGNKSAGRLGWATFTAAVLSIIVTILVAIFT